MYEDETSISLDHQTGGSKKKMIQGAHEGPAHKGQAHKGPVRPNKGPAHEGPVRPMRARPLRAQGGP